MKANALTQKKFSEFDFNKLVEEFRSLDPHDPGQWPLVPRLIILAGLLVGALVLGWFFLWNPQSELLSQKQAEEVKFKEDWLSKKRQAANLDEYKKQLADIDRQFGALLKQLPNRAEMEALLVDINQAGRGRGLQFDLWKPGVEATRDFYAALPIALKVTGSYDDLGYFASDLAKLPRIVTLSDISVENTKDGGLKLEANAVTYRYLDEEEVAKQRQEKAAKDKGGKGKKK